MVMEHEKRQNKRSQEASNETEMKPLSPYSNRNSKHGLFDLKGLTCRMVEVELLATIPMSEGIQTQTLALKVEVGI